MKAKEVVAQLKEEGIIRQDKALWYKAKVYAYNGNLYLTNKRLVFEKYPMNILGVLGILLQSIMPKKIQHDIDLKTITAITPVKFLKVIKLEITYGDNLKATYLVKDFEWWKAEIGKLTGKSF